jgi:MtN3 and saliva related transmembrane protein
MFEAIGFVAATLTAAAFAPQVLKSWRTRSCSDLATGMVLSQSAGVALWIIYGVGIGSPPVVVANSVTLVLMLALLALKLRYGSSIS